MTQSAPWLVRPEWAARTIPNINRGSLAGLVFLWGFALVWNGFLAVMFLVTRAANDGPGAGTLAAILSPFLLAGLFLLWLAVSMSATLYRYRSLMVRLETLPGVLGGKLSATLHGAQGVVADGMTVRLTCWRRYPGSDTSDDVLWDDVEEIRPESIYRAPDGSVAPFTIGIPFECEPTGGRDGKIEWQLTVHAADGDVVGAFDVPVYRTEDSSEAVTEKTLRPRSMLQPPFSKLKLRDTADGSVEVQFPKPSWVWKWYITTLIAGGGAFVAAEEIRIRVPDLVIDGRPGLWPNVLYLGVAAVVLCFLAIIQLGLFFSPRLLTVRHDTMEMRYYSLFRGARVVPASEIADIDVKFSNSTRKYDVDIQRSSGSKDPWMMMSSNDRREAEWLAHEIRRALPRHAEEPAAVPRAG